MFHKQWTIYFKHFGGEQPTDVYNLVLAEVEKPLLEAKMHSGITKARLLRFCELIAVLAAKSFSIMG